MKKFKFILPMLAFIMAIGMSFAFVNASGEDLYASGTIFIDGNPYAVEVNCSSGEENCLVTLEGDETETEYQVLDSMGNPLKSVAPAPVLIEDPRP